jgi:hypothetical protein
MDFWMLEAAVQGVSAEVYVNDVPLTFLDPIKAPQENQPVNHYLFDGWNQISAIISPGPTPSQVRVGGLTLKATSNLSLMVRLTQYPKGAFPGDPSGSLGAALQWSARVGDTYKTAQEITTSADLGAMFGQWTFESCAPLQLSPDLINAAVAQIQNLADTLRRGDAEPFLNLANIRFQENARAYSLDAEARKQAWRANLAKKAMDPSWNVLPINRASMDLRLCARRRMIQCIAKDWSPILGAAPDDDGAATVRYPIFFSKIHDVLYIAR